MRTVVLGYHNVGCVGLDVLLRHGNEVVGVYTHRDDPLEDVWFESVADLAASHGLDVQFPEDINEDRWIERIRFQQPEAIFSLCYGQPLGDQLRSIPPLGVFHLDGSSLPGDAAEAALTLSRLDSQTADTVVGTRCVAMAGEDTPLRCHGKLTRAAGELLTEVLPMIAPAGVIG